MEQILYTSHASDALSSDDVFAIVQVSSRRNPLREITGFLLYDQGRFLQLVEGPAEQLDQLLTDLGKDSRHHSVEILERKSIAERSFPRWRMKRIMSSAQTDFLKELKSGAGMAKPPSADVLGHVSAFLNTA